ncbi:MAG: oligosaccharide flippase family protein [Methanosarcinaceae archaeon]
MSQSPALGTCYVHCQHGVSGESVRTVRKIAKNAGVIIAGNVAFRLVSPFVVICLARYLGTAGFGKYRFVFAYLAFFSIITDLGLQQILVRDMAREPPTAPVLIGNAYAIRLLLTVFAVALAITIITLLPYPADTTLYVYVASLMLLFMRFFDLILIPDRGYNDAAIATVVKVAVLALSLFHFVSKHLWTIPVHKVVVKPMVATVVMGVFVYYFMNFNVGIVVLLAAVVYVIMLSALKTVSKEEIEMVKSIISSIKHL